jgi:hypothetical protein
MNITRGSQSFTGDGITVTFLVTVDEVDNFYTPIVNVQNGLGDWTLGNFTTKVIRVVFSQPPPAIAPPFTVHYLIARD